MKHRFWLATLALTAAFAQTPTSIYACPAAHHTIENITKKLDLTPDQIEKIKAIKTNTKKDIKEKIHNLHDIRLKINQIFDTNGTVDVSKLDPLLQQQSELLSEVMKIRLYTRVAIHNILTLPQREKFRHMFRKWEENRK